MTLSATVLVSACAPGLSERPCPRVTEFTLRLQQEVIEEIKDAASAARMLDAMAADRAFNRAICGP